MSIGVSFSAGKDAIKNWITKHFPENSTILDIGAGGGTYSKLLSDYNYIIDAVEVFEPTIPYIINLYRSIYCIDIKEFQFQQNYDLIIMGDVLEHLTVEDAQIVLHTVLQHCKYILVAFPFMYPQGPEEDNPKEAHLQEDLNFTSVKNRYPQLELLLYIKTDKCMHYIDSDEPFWVEYAYYIAKGVEHEFNN